MRKNRPSLTHRSRLKKRARLMRSERCQACRRKLCAGFGRGRSGELLCLLCWSGQARRRSGKIERT